VYYQGKVGTEKKIWKEKKDQEKIGVWQDCEFAGELCRQPWVGWNEINLINFFLAKLEPFKICIGHKNMLSQKRMNCAKYNKET